MSKLFNMPLGRLKPVDWEHVDKYPIRQLATADQPRGVPCAMGINWYTEFDRPEKVDGRWWVARDGKLSTVRGGHCVCIKAHQPDLMGWYQFYDQGQEGACVGFGESRMMTLLNRQRYNARWLWQQARLHDEWSSNDDLNDQSQGTSVRAGLQILKSQGALPVRDTDPVPADGISAYRWATIVEEVLDVLNMPLAHRLGAVPFLNSWGFSYPHITWMTGEVLQRLINEDGEVAIVTDR